MNRNDADATLLQVSELAVKAIKQNGASRRETCLYLATFAVQVLAWAGIETGERKARADS